MDDAFALGDYLPYSYRSSGEKEYIDFLWNAFVKNYETENFQFAFLAYHMLAMSFVYFSIWRIRAVEEKQFVTALLGFNKDHEKLLLEAITPFTFAQVPESTMLRFLKLLGCDNGKIGTYAQLVKDRNLSAHANGHIYYNSSSNIDVKIAEVMRVVKEIQNHSALIISKCYESFLVGSSNPEVREFPDAIDQVREQLVRQNYFSSADIEICTKFDISLLGSHPAFDEICVLHNTISSDIWTDF